MKAKARQVRKTWAWSENRDFYCYHLITLPTEPENHEIFQHLTVMLINDVPNLVSCKVIQSLVWNSFADVKWKQVVRWLDECVCVHPCGWFIYISFQLSLNPFTWQRQHKMHCSLSGSSIALHTDTFLFQETKTGRRESNLKHVFDPLQNNICPQATLHV